MIKVHCDRCKKDITNKPKYKFSIKWKALLRNGVCIAIPAEEDKQSELDLCTDCYNDFKKFMEEK